MPVADQARPLEAVVRDPGRRPPRLSRRSSRPAWVWQFAFVLPACLFIAVFVIWPIARTLVLSVYDWNFVSPDRRYVGLENYTSLLTDPEFYSLLWRSLFYIAISLLGNFLLAVGLAMLTMRFAGKAAPVFQTLLFTPTVIATAVGALLWQYIYLPADGPLNELLGLVGVPGVNWLNDPSYALPAVGVVSAWKTMGFNYLIALAGLAAISSTLLEAARVDGATGWRLIVYVVVPLLMPTLLFLATTSVLQALPMAFVPVEILTGGGPANASNNLLYSVYQEGLRFFQVGRASAEAVVLMIVIGGAAVWQTRILDRSITYER